MRREGTLSETMDDNGWLTEIYLTSRQGCTTENKVYDSARKASRGGRAPGFLCFRGIFVFTLEKNATGKDGYYLSPPHAVPLSVSPRSKVLHPQVKGAVVIVGDVHVEEGYLSVGTFLATIFQLCCARFDHFAAGQGHTKIFEVEDKRVEELHLSKVQLAHLHYRKSSSLSDDCDLVGDM